MNRDIDIREHAVIIKFDHGHEETEQESVDLGINTEGQHMRLVYYKNKEGKLVRVKIQNL